MYYFVLMSLLFAGCATPLVMTGKQKIDLDKFKTVYLVKPEMDPQNLTSIVEAKMKSIGFDVRTVNPKDQYDAQGTGFVISPRGHILTCEHVIGEQKAATLWIQGKRMEADVACKDKEKDLALLRIKTSDSFIPLVFDFKNEPKMGDEVFTMGFPMSNILGNSPRLTKGLVNSEVGLKDNPRQIQVSAEVQPGNSGGPIFNKNGVVIGIIQKMLNRSQNANFGLKSKEIKEFLATCEEKTQIAFITEKKVNDTFDSMKNSIARVYAGNVTEEWLKAPKLASSFVYSHYGVYGNIGSFEIVFIDMETEQPLLSLFDTGNLNFVIDSIMEEVGKKFFQKPN